MRRTLLGGKIHRATVIQADLHQRSGRSVALAG
jgi:aspartate 1-decarboxylase